MKLLAIDTATEACSVALWVDGEIRERFELAGREHSLRLPKMFALLLAEAGLRAAELDGLVAGIGPGSFAGVRIGIAFVKGLGLGIDRPALGVSSLAMLAQGAIRTRTAQQVLSAIDARMDQIYIGAFGCEQGRASLLGEEAVIAPSQFSAPPLDVFAAVGSGWGIWGEALAAGLPRPPLWTDAAALPHAQDAFALALPGFAEGLARNAAELAPNYLRNRVALTSKEQIAARQEAQAKRS